MKKSNTNPQKEKGISFPLLNVIFKSFTESEIKWGRSTGEEKKKEGKREVRGDISVGNGGGTESPGMWMSECPTGH